MQITKIKFLVFFLACFFDMQKVFAAPEITNFTGLMQDGQSITINGSGFGTKNQAAPLKFFNFESDTIGQIPNVWEATLSTKSLVTNINSHNGSRSLDSSALNKTDDYFPRDSFDLQSTISPNSYLFLSSWVYLDHSGTTASMWNWKGPLITSNNRTSTGSSYYWEATGASTSNVAIGFADYYSESDSRWFNTATTIQNSTSGTAAYNYCTTGNSLATDSFILNGWQRVDWIFKTNSIGSSNGSVTINRIGKSLPAHNATGCIMYGDTSDYYRYVSLPQGFTGIQNGTLNLAMLFDDVYVDNTIARIEICDSTTWATRAHCEIQIPQNQWIDGQLQFKVNKGSFADNSNAYIYIIDANGNSNQNGYPVTFTSSAQAYSISDYIYLISTWFHSGSGNYTDFNSDNIVNSKDLGIMMSKWN